MQITIKEVKILKTGTNPDHPEYGPWTLTAVTTDKGVKYTTFAKDAELLAPGSIINITDMDEDEKGKKFKKFEIVAGGEKAETPNRPEGQPSDNEYWERKQAIERASIEGQNALTNLTKLTIAGIKLEDCPALLMQAIESKIKGFMGAMSTTAPPKSGIEKAEKDDPPKALAKPIPEGGLPKTTEELYDWIAKMMKWKDAKPARSWIVNKIRIEEARIDSDPEGCYYEIKELMGW